MEGGDAMIDLPSTRWPHQVQAFHGALDAIKRGVKRLCITAPTGAGKTFMFTDMLDWAFSEEMTALVLTQRRMLFEQTCRVLDDQGISYSKVASGYDDELPRSIQIAMVQTLLSHAKRKANWHPFSAGLLLVDEMHLFRGDEYQAMLARHTPVITVGYTATPLDLVGVDELLIAGNQSECRNCGALVRPNTIGVDEPDLRHIKKYQVGEDLTDKDNAKAIMRPGVVGRVLEAWKAYNPEQKPTLLFGPDVAGSIFFAQQFSAAGVRAAHIDGEDCWLDGEFYASKQDVREEIVRLFKAGEVKILCNRFVLREGINIREVEVVILATVFGSLSSFLQATGRGLRACPETGKTECLFLDHGGNWHRHGSPGEDRIWKLGLTNREAVGGRASRLRGDDGPKEKEPIRCPQCGKVRAGGRECPQCHFVAHRSSRVVVQVDGTLRPITGDVYRKRGRVERNDTVKNWQGVYYAAKNSKKGMTFRQAEAWFFQKHHHWPPHTLAMMPKTPSDWFRRVADVAREDLIQ